MLTGQAKVMRQSDELVEVAFVRDPAGPFLFRTVLHYVLRRGDSGFYLYMTAAHDAQMPAGYIVQYAYNLRLAPQYFDYIAVDDVRRHISHTCEEEGTAAGPQTAPCVWGRTPESRSLPRSVRIT